MARVSTLPGGSSLEGYADDVTLSMAVYNDDDVANVNRELRVWLVRGHWFLPAAEKNLITHPPGFEGVHWWEEVERVSSNKLLGVEVTADLTWSTHISSICAWVNGSWAVFTRPLA